MLLVFLGGPRNPSGGRAGLTTLFWGGPAGPQIFGGPAGPPKPLLGGLLRILLLGFPVHFCAFECTGFAFWGPCRAHKIPLQGPQDPLSVGCCAVFCWAAAVAVVVVAVVVVVVVVVVAGVAWVPVRQLLSVAESPSLFSVVFATKQGEALPVCLFCCFGLENGF